MRPKKYPLDPLVQVRAKQVDDAARALGEAARVHEAATRARQTAEERRDEAEAEARMLKRGEFGALERGELTVADLMRGDAWSVRVKAEQDELARRALESSKREELAESAEASARGDVASRKADAEIVDRDRVKWVNGERRKADAKEEEAAADGWRPKQS